MVGVENRMIVRANRAPVNRDLTRASAAIGREHVGRDLDPPAGVRPGAGIDCSDYTKGINEKFQAIQRLLEARPELIGRFAFIQVAEPGHGCLAAYRAAGAQVVETCQRINARFRAEAGPPIRFLAPHYERASARAHAARGRRAALAVRRGRTSRLDWMCTLS